MISAHNCFRHSNSSSEKLMKKKNPKVFTPRARRRCSLCFYVHRIIGANILQMQSGHLTDRAICTCHVSVRRIMVFDSFFSPFSSFLNSTMQWRRCVHENLVVLVAPFLNSFCLWKLFRRLSHQWSLVSATLFYICPNTIRIHSHAIHWSNQIKIRAIECHWIIAIKSFR